ncbi:TetR/AcrR family transcriptional regulator [Agromyces cerinus]|uniref:Transcriptional regulator, TetR family n=1 Tax=Agromyces cerinus subsp. cerinus TaxID=232089 RepID=A0A1N6I7L1_9MICO|nr:TetR/AcrR family transcriptional regulator [Agromyces cerinus]SIO28004.1 transcriptional regulator, TetR family [Agromyces cerinus subsp. cerinus]
MTTATGSNRGGAARASNGRARLDRDSIVAAGLELAATSATSTISVRELGAQLGADPTAIYRHFRSKEQLMEALLDELTLRAIAEVTAEKSDWRERLRQLASATLTNYSAHPAIGAEAIVLTTHGPGELEAIEIMLESFAEAGLTGDDVVRHYALMASHVLSSAAGIARGRAERGDGPEPGPWFDGPILADPRRFPLITAFNSELADLKDVDLFLLGVEAVIQSAELTVARNAQ